MVMCCPAVIHGCQVHASNRASLENTPPGPGKPKAACLRWDAQGRVVLGGVSEASQSGRESGVRQLSQPLERLSGYKIPIVVFVGKLCLFLALVSTIKV